MITQRLPSCQISLPQGKDTLFTLRRQTLQILTDYSLSSSRNLFCTPSVTRLCQAAHASTVPIIRLPCHYCSDPPTDPQPTTMGAEWTPNCNDSLPLLLPQPSLQTVKNSGFFMGQLQHITPFKLCSFSAGLDQISLGCWRPWETQQELRVVEPHEWCGCSAQEQQLRAGPAVVTSHPAESRASPHGHTG